MKSQKGIAGIVLIAITAVVLGGVFLYIRNDPQIQGYESSLKKIFSPKDDGVVIDLPPIPVSPLTVAAGDDISILSPMSTVSLSGSATSTVGGAVTYTWIKLSGGKATIASPKSKKTTLSGLARGVYIFRLIAADSAGNKAADDMIVAVFPLPSGTPGASTYVPPVGSAGGGSTPLPTPSDIPRPNIPPFASAGGDQTLSAANPATTLSGVGSDSDGTIVSYRWSQVSGGAATILSPYTYATQISGLTLGSSYVFRLTVTDNQGGIASDDVAISVNASVPTPSPSPTPTPTPNVAPVAHAGNNESITLPVDTLILSGTGSDSDGTIVSYAWSKVSGGVATIASPTTAITDINNLVQGTYVFRLTVTDNKGATGSDTLTVTVLPAIVGNIPPIADAGADQMIAGSSTTLVGAGTDDDGTIISYQWARTAGDVGATITTPSVATTTVTGLLSGDYTFSLTVTDNQGATDTASVVVSVE